MLYSIVSHLLELTAQFPYGSASAFQEGAIQYYKALHTNQIIIGAVGQLQFEVFEHRLKNEYNVDVVMEPVGQKIARWIENEDAIKDNMSTYSYYL